MPQGNLKGYNIMGVSLCHCSPNPQLRTPDTYFKDHTAQIAQVPAMGRIDVLGLAVLLQSFINPTRFTGAHP